MRNYRTELIAICLQAGAFFLFPLFFDVLTPFGTVFLLILWTVLLGLAVGVGSVRRLRYLYPILVALLFLPSVPVFYNSSALIHSLWYFAVALFGLVVGAAAHRLIYGKRQRDKK